MSLSKLVLEIHADQPSWIHYENNKYRLYVDDNLLTERNWLWHKKSYIEETAWLDIDSGQHNVRLELIKNPPHSTAKLSIRNALIDDRPISVPESCIELSFST